jgi:hypothetical protein
MALPVATVDDVLTIGELLEESFEMQTASLRESVEQGNGFLAQLVEMGKEDRFAEKENRLEASRAIPEVGMLEGGATAEAVAEPVQMGGFAKGITSLLAIIGVGGLVAGENTLTGALMG